MVSSSSVIMCTDSDSSSELTKASLQLSCTDSAPIGCSLEDQMNYYQNKLLSTLQILKNKDEMLSIQGESLQMAEKRIATLTVRNAQLQAELDRKINEIRALQRNLELKSNILSKPQVKNGSEITIKQLKNNLSVIENLYRDSFYESARQEAMIEMLRNSFLDVRLTNTEKCDEISRLRSIVVSQKWDLENCQVIAEELEGLKSEIANVLNNASNDSGMWERIEESSPNEISSELNEITEQLLQLRDILHTDCTCGLLEENKLLKRDNAQLNSGLDMLKNRTEELENSVSQKDQIIDQYKSKIEENEAQVEMLSDSIRESEHCKEELLQDREDLIRDREELLRERDGLLRDKDEQISRLKVNLQREREVLLRDTEENISRLRVEMQEKDDLLRDKDEQTSRLKTQLVQEREGRDEQMSRLREELVREREELLRDKDEQMSRLRGEMRELELSASDGRQRLQETSQDALAARKSLECLKEKLKSSKCAIKCKATDLDRLRAVCQNHESTIQTLREALNSAQVQLKEHSRLRSGSSLADEQGVAEMRAQVAASAQRTRELETQLAMARTAYDNLNCSFRNKSQSAAWLEGELAEATSRGAELCAESRHVVSGVRHWMQRMRHEHQDQQRVIQDLQRRLRATRLRPGALEGASSDISFRSCVTRSENQCPNSLEKSRCSMERGFRDGGSSDSCSSGARSTPTLSPPPPPPPPAPDARRERSRRRKACRGCDAARAASPGSGNDMSPEEELMTTIDSAGNYFNSRNKLFLKNMRSYQSTSGPPH